MTVPLPGRHGVRIGAIALGLLACARPSSGAPQSCVTTLADVRSGSAQKNFASHYVTVGAYGYGEYVAGGFGGQSLWKKRGATWCRIPTGAATLDRSSIVRFGVPDRVAGRLLREMHASAPELAPPLAPTPLVLRGRRR